MGYIEHWLHYKKFKKWQFLLFLLFSLPTGRSLKSHEIVCHGRLKCRRAVPKTYKEITWGHERWGVAKPRGLQFFSGQVFCWTWVALTVLTRNGGGGKLFNNHLYWHLRNGAIKKEVMGEKNFSGTWKPLPLSSYSYSFLSLLETPSGCLSARETRIIFNL